MTISHPPGGRLPLLSGRPAVTSPAAEHHRLLAGTKLYCLVTEAHRCEQTTLPWPTAFWLPPGYNFGSDEGIAEIEGLRDVAMATAFGTTLAVNGL